MSDNELRMELRDNIQIFSNISGLDTETSAKCLLAAIKGFEEE